MSREYEMIVQVTAFESSRRKSIEKACCEEWPFEPEGFSVEKNGDNALVLMARAPGSLCGGESEEEFTDRLAIAIWKANQSYCEVEVQAFYLEDLPYEQHVREEDDYQRLMEKNSQGGKKL